MSLIRFRRSVPAPWIVRANSDLAVGQVAVRVLGELLAEDQDAVERRAQLVRHVREELGLVPRRQRELGRLLLEPPGARTRSRLFLRSTSDVLLGEQPRLWSRARRWSAAAPSAASAARRRAAATASAAPSVRIVASIVLSTTPMLPVSCSRNARCEAVNSPSEASSMTALTWPSNSTGSTMMLRGRATARPECTLDQVSAGCPSARMRWRSFAHWPTSPSPRR